MPEIAEGQVWRHKRDSFRRVTVTGVQGEYVYVDRNTSRRTQAIREDTLRRNYELTR